MKYLILLLLSFPAFAQNHKTIKVAVVDTGLDLSDPRVSSHLCKSGHKDFTGEGIRDTIGHGTFVTGLIVQYAKNSNYCLLIYKIYAKNGDGMEALERESVAFKEAIKNGASIINFSGGGPVENLKEYLTIKDNPDTIFVVAAGNNGKDLDLMENAFYPASYFRQNEIVVGGVNRDNNRVYSSNYGSQVKVTELGEDVLSITPDGRTARESGTSFSTAIHTGKLIREMNAR